LLARPFAASIGTRLGGSILTLIGEALPVDAPSIWTVVITAATFLTFAVNTCLAGRTLSAITKFDHAIAIDTTIPLGAFAGKSAFRL